jgi:cation:H+ antiporter
LTLESLLDIAALLQMSETAVGVTVLGVVASLPELVTTLSAALRGYSSVAVGNVIGSSTLNVFLVAGLGLLASREPVPVTRQFALENLTVMLACMIVLTVLALRGSAVGRRMGGLLLASYAAYLWLLAS